MENSSLHPYYFSFWNKETYICTCALPIPPCGGAPSTPAEVPGPSVPSPQMCSGWPHFPELRGVLKHPTSPTHARPTHHANHMLTPGLYRKSTALTGPQLPKRIPIVCINEPDRKHVSRQAPFYRIPWSFLFRCLVFVLIFVLMSTVYCTPDQLSWSLGFGVVVFSFGLFASRSQMDAVCVCALHRLLCLSGLCSLFLMWGCLCCR